MQYTWSPARCSSPLCSNESARGSLATREKGPPPLDSHRQEDDVRARCAAPFRRSRRKLGEPTSPSHSIQPRATSSLPSTSAPAPGRLQGTQSEEETDQGPPSLSGRTCVCPWHPRSLLQPPTTVSASPARKAALDRMACGARRSCAHARDARSKRQASQAPRPGVPVTTRARSPGPACSSRDPREERKREDWWLSVICSAETPSSPMDRCQTREEPFSSTNTTLADAGSCTARDPDLTSRGRGRVRTAHAGRRSSTQRWPSSQRTLPWGGADGEALSSCGARVPAS
mmetsp:Transcript_75944/g.214782  ORF Transcript_75944/g.214782 Transcript_75944/m.214782 type:complete len:287 (-) Transcript_75944:42-902(-)